LIGADDVNGKNAEELFLLLVSKYHEDKEALAEIAYQKASGPKDPERARLHALDVIRGMGLLW